MTTRRRYRKRERAASATAPLVPEAEAEALAEPDELPGRSDWVKPLLTGGYVVAFLLLWWVASFSGAALIVYGIVLALAVRLTWWGFGPVGGTPAALRRGLPDKLDPIIIREYRSTHEYQLDSAQLAPWGYRVRTVTESTQRSGCLRIVLIGFLALLWRPAPHIVVTYELR